MRRLARHAGPDVLAGRFASRANDVGAGQDQHERRDDLQRRDDAERLHERRVAEVNGAPGVDHRLVLAVEHANVFLDPRVAVVDRVERQIGMCDRVARLVGEDERHTLLADSYGNVEQRLDRSRRAAFGLGPIHP